MGLRLSLGLGLLLQLAAAAVLPAPGAVSAATISSPSRSSHSSAKLPLLIWHGLGDAFDADGIKAVGDLYRKIYPESAVYVVHFGENGGEDRHASFFGNVTEQVQQVCDDIRDNDELAHAPLANALGFSQGGVFLRGLIERCDAVNVQNLVTFGSPHSGITQFAECGDSDWWCKIWSGTLRSNTWGSFAQSTLIPAQYFRDSADLDNFLLYSNFLADVNNERERKQDVYKKRIASMNRFVMYKFQDEDVIHPPEASWFADSNTTTGTLTKLKERDMYKEDWLGLKKLDEAGGVIFRTTPGKHMQIQDDALEDAFRRYFAPADSDAWLDTALSDSIQAVLGQIHSSEPLQQDAVSTEQLGDDAGSQLLRYYFEAVENTFN